MDAIATTEATARPGSPGTVWESWVKLFKLSQNQIDLYPCFFIVFLILDQETKEKARYGSTFWTKARADQRSKGKTGVQIKRGRQIKETEEKAGYRSALTSKPDLVGERKAQIEEDGLALSNDVSRTF